MATPAETFKTVARIVELCATLDLEQVRWLLERLEAGLPDPALAPLPPLVGTYGDRAALERIAVLARVYEEVCSLIAEVRRLRAAFPYVPPPPPPKRDPDHPCSIYETSGDLPRVCAGDGHHLCSTCVRLEPPAREGQGAGTLRCTNCGATAHVPAGGGEVTLQHRDDCGDPAVVLTAGAGKDGGR